MTQVRVYYSPDYQNLGQLKGARKYNLDTASREALGSVLGAGNEGVFVWDTDEKVGYTWSGAAWASPGGGTELSRYHISEGEVVTVPENFNMITVDGLEVEGEVLVEGRVVEVS